MSLTINTTPEQDQLIASLANREGISVEKYAIQRLLGAGSTTSTTIMPTVPPWGQAQGAPVQTEESLAELLRSVGDEHAPPIPLEALSRERIYERDDEE